MKRSGVIGLIFVVALALRVVGIDHGFPFIFHPDEPTIVRSALSVRFFLNPGHFDWPHLYIYANYFLYMNFAAVREFITNSTYHDLASKYLAIIYNDELIFYLLTRLFSAFLGALTVVPVYLTGRKLFGEKAGVFAAFAFALLPFHIRHSHYSLPDVPMVFLFSWVIYFATCIYSEGKLDDYLLAGLLAGFATSTKYHGGLSVLSILLAHVMYFKNPLKKFYFLILSGLFAITGCIIGTPYAVLDYKTFLRTDSPVGALWQFTNVGSREPLDIVINAFHNLTSKIPGDVGYVVVVGFVGIFTLLLYRLVKKQRLPADTNLWFVIIPALVLICYISGFEKSRSHYIMVIYPYLALTFGYCVNMLMEFSGRKSKILPSIVFPALFAPLFYSAVFAAFVFYNGDTRQLLYKWGRANFDSRFPIMYADQSSSVVLKSFAKNIYRVPAGDINVPEGYLYSQDDSFPFETLQKKARVLNLLFEADNKYLNGPSIKFYSYSL